MEGGGKTAFLQHNVRYFSAGNQTKFEQQTGGKICDKQLQGYTYLIRGKQLQCGMCGETWPLSTNPNIKSIVQSIKDRGFTIYYSEKQGKFGFKCNHCAHWNLNIENWRRYIEQMKKPLEITEQRLLIKVYIIFFEHSSFCFLKNII